MAVLFFVVVAPQAAMIGWLLGLYALEPVGPNTKIPAMISYKRPLVALKCSRTYVITLSSAGLLTAAFGPYVVETCERAHYPIEQTRCGDLADLPDALLAMTATATAAFSDTTSLAPIQVT